jgi:hypothetical protein
MNLACCVSRAPASRRRGELRRIFPIRDLALRHADPRRPCRTSVRGDCSIWQLIEWRNVSDVSASGTPMKIDRKGSLA